MKAASRLLVSALAIWVVPAMAQQDDEVCKAALVPLIHITKIDQLSARSFLSVLNRQTYKDDSTQVKTGFEIFKVPFTGDYDKDVKEFEKIYSVTKEDTLSTSSMISLHTMLPDTAYNAFMKCEEDHATTPGIYAFVDGVSDKEVSVRVKNVPGVGGANGRAQVKAEGGPSCAVVGTATAVVLSGTHGKTFTFKRPQKGICLAKLKSWTDKDVPIGAPSAKLGNARNFQKSGFSAAGEGDCATAPADIIPAKTLACVSINGAWAPFTGGLSPAGIPRTKVQTRGAKDGKPITDWSPYQHPNRVGENEKVPYYICLKAPDGATGEWPGQPITLWVTVNAPVCIPTL